MRSAGDNAKQQRQERAAADNVRQSFLRRQYEDAMSLAAESDILDLLPVAGTPPDRYIARFRAMGLVRTDKGDIVEADRFDVGIWLPEDYLRRAESAQVFTYIGPSRAPWHPNIRPPFICLHLTPGMPLVDLLYSCFELWTWNLFYTGDDGLNGEASQWARHQSPDRFPTDRRPLRRRTLNLSIEEKKQPQETDSSDD